MRGGVTGLYLPAYQRHLWNRFLARWLTRNLPESNRVNVRMKLNPAPFPRNLNEAQATQLAGLALPLPSARLKYEDGVAGTPEDWPEVLREVMSEEKIDLAALQLRGLRRPFFSRGERALVC